MQLRDITGQRFGRLTVIKRTERPPYYADSNAWWLCKCDCGTEITVPGRDLWRGNTRSCGCYKLDLLRGKPSRRKKKED